MRICSEGNTPPKLESSHSISGEIPDLLVATRSGSSGGGEGGGGEGPSSPRLDEGHVNITSEGGSRKDGDHPNQQEVSRDPEAVCQGGGTKHRIYGGLPRLVRKRRLASEEPSTAPEIMQPKGYQDRRGRPAATVAEVPPSEEVMSAEAVVTEASGWVQCDSCNKWREIPEGHKVGVNYVLDIQGSFLVCKPLFLP